MKYIYNIYISTQPSGPKEPKDNISLYSPEGPLGSSADLDIFGNLCVSKVCSKFVCLTSVKDAALATLARLYLVPAGYIATGQISCGLYNQRADKYQPL